MSRSHLVRPTRPPASDRKSTRLNSSHTIISYAVFCLKKQTSARRERRTPPWNRPAHTPTAAVRPHRGTSPRRQPPALGSTFRCSFLCSFFFLKNGPPPKIPPFPLPAAFPT